MCYNGSNNGCVLEVDYVFSGSLSGRGVAVFAYTPHSVGDRDFYSEQHHGAPTE